LLFGGRFDLQRADEPVNEESQPAADEDVICIICYVEWQILFHRDYKCGDSWAEVG
jgi:hypothetical protein